MGIEEKFFLHRQMAPQNQMETMCDKFSKSELAHEVAKKFVDGIVDKMLKEREKGSGKYDFSVVTRVSKWAIYCEEREERYKRWSEWFSFTREHCKPLESELEQGGLAVFVSKCIKEMLIKRYPILQEQDISITLTFRGEEAVAQVNCEIPFEKIAPLREWF